MALEVIAVADIRKGQKIRWETTDDLVLSTGVFAQEYIALRDGQGYFNVRDGHYLIEDVPATPFEVPWETVQRDKNSNVWEFFDEDDGGGYVGIQGGCTMSEGQAEQCAPFTRLYTVQELVELYREFNRVGFAEVLACDQQDGLV